MDSGISTTMRARKVIYDDYTNGFYVESRVEALERQVATRAKLTDVLNRSHDTRLKEETRRVNAEKGLFEKKNEKETTHHREHLKETAAHRHVLNEISRSRVTDKSGARAESHLGHYGLGASKLEIQPMIERHLKENTSSAKRLRQSRTIQTKRRSIKLFDRTKSTSALLKMKPQLKSRPTSDLKKGEGGNNQSSHSASASGGNSQLHLPPITVRWAKHLHEDSSEKTHIIQGHKHKDGESSKTTLPTVFITQGRLS